MVKRSRGKSNRNKQRYSSTLLCEKTTYSKVLLQVMFEITTKSSLASLTVTINGAADLPARNLPQHEEFHAKPLMSV